MATGHYIQRKVGPNGPELHSAEDANRDQSYFLFSTTPEQLDFLRFPLGHLPSKDATREMAAQARVAQEGSAETAESSEEASPKEQKSAEQKPARRNLPPYLRVVK